MPTPGAEVLVRCPAKLNLFLEVVARRPDGYHELETVMQAVDLWDDLRVAARPGPELTLECSDPSLPTDERNLALRAAIALRDHAGHRGGAHLRLVKRIPAGAGLGGGSSDAAGALVGLDAAWGLGLPPAELARVAAAVGSDVAFFLPGGTAWCTGRGERVEPLAAAGPFHYVLVCPAVGVSTAAAYGAVRLPLTPERARATMLRRSLREGRVEGVGRGLFNRLEEPAFELCPSLAGWKAGLGAAWDFAGVGMSGSGSALFGLCRPGRWPEAIERAAALELGATLGVRSIGHGVRIAGR